MPVLTYHCVTSTTTSDYQYVSLLKRIDPYLFSFAHCGWFKQLNIRSDYTVYSAPPGSTSVHDGVTDMVYDVGSKEYNEAYIELADRVIAYRGVHIPDEYFDNEVSFITHDHGEGWKRLIVGENEGSDYWMFVELPDDLSAVQFRLSTC